MTDFTTITEQFDEAVEIRKELNSVHWKDYSTLKTVFGALFATDPATLKTISDMNYYQGGYPSENSPPKLDALFDKAGTVLRFYTAIDRLDEINAILEKHGFKITPTIAPEDMVPMYAASLSEDKATIKAVDNAMARFGFRQFPDGPEMVRWFLEQTLELQAIICSKADEIKIDLYEEVAEKLEGSIDKSGFSSAVNAVAGRKLKEESGKDIASLVEKTLERSEVLGNNGELLREKISEGLQ